LILVFSFFRGVALALGNNTSAVLRQGASVVRRVRGGETSHLQVESIRFWHHNASRRFEQPFFSIGNDIFCFFKVSSCSPCREDHGGGLGFARRPAVGQPHRQVATQKRASRIASVPNCEHCWLGLIELAVRTHFDFYTFDSAGGLFQRPT
jgi:hypothetical protein